METITDIQNVLFDRLKSCDNDKARDILLAHPELTNAKRTDDLEQEVTTPLIEACRAGLHEVVMVLLENGAYVSATGNIHYDAWYSYPGRGIITNLGSSRGGFGALDDVFPLFAATAFCEYEIEKTLKVLLAGGADINQRTAIGQTTLHVLCTTSNCDYHADQFSLDDNIVPKTIESEAMGILLDHGADVNICDDSGKTPLHYAAQFGKKYLAQILIRNSANVYFKNNVGLTALDYASTKDYLLTMALVDKYSFPLAQIIQAYECVALNAPSKSQMLRKATHLREVHGIPKIVLPPVECYGYEREWTTIEELEKYGGSEAALRLQCLLARERISVEHHNDVAPEYIIKLVWKNGNRDINFKRQFNSLLRHLLNRFSYFGKYLHFVESLVMGDISLNAALCGEVLLSNDVLVKFVLVAIDSCYAIQNRLNFERKPGCVQELISSMEQTVLIIGGVIVHLVKRSDRDLDKTVDRKCHQEFSSDHRIAKLLLDELLIRCPMISAPSCGYSSPLTNILFKEEYKQMLYVYLTKQCTRYNYRLMKMIVESQYDLNVPDSQGNTILHVVISDVFREIDFSEEFASDHIAPPCYLMDTAVDITQLLLENGSYPHSRNKNGRCPGEDVFYGHRELNKPNSENLILRFKDLLAKYDCTLTLKYFAASKIVDSKIQYANLLPKELVKFVDLH